MPLCPMHLICDQGDRLPAGGQGTSSLAIVITLHAPSLLGAKRVFHSYIQLHIVILISQQYWDI